MKKKVLAAIMAAAVILAGCGGSDGGESSPLETLAPVIIEETPEPAPDATEEPEEGEEEPDEVREGMYRKIGRAHV